MSIIIKLYYRNNHVIILFHYKHNVQRLSTLCTAKSWCSPCSSATWATRARGPGWTARSKWIWRCTAVMIGSIRSWTKPTGVGWSICTTAIIVVVTISKHVSQDSSCHGTCPESSTSAATCWCSCVATASLVGRRTWWSYKRKIYNQLHIYILQKGFLATLGKGLWKEIVKINWQNSNFWGECSNLLILTSLNQWFSVRIACLVSDIQ